MRKNELLAEFKRKGLTQEEVAKILSIHPTTITKKINGQTEFTLSELNSMIKLLDLSLEQIATIFFD